MESDALSEKKELEQQDDFYIAQGYSGSNGYDHHIHLWGKHGAYDDYVLCVKESRLEDPSPLIINLSEKYQNHRFTSSFSSYELPKCNLKFVFPIL